MTDEPKDTKKISKIGSDKLTPKQRNFVNELVKGKVKSIKEAYAKSYEVKLNEDGSIPKWCSVEASKLMANNLTLPKHYSVALSKGSQAFLLLTCGQKIMSLKDYLQRVKKQTEVARGSKR